VGEPGVYGAGNVSSISTVDNIEHLYLTDLEAGDYAIEVRRKSGAQAAQPVAIAWYMTDTGPFGDLNGDDRIDAADIAILLGQWGGDGSADLDDDGIVGAADLAILLGAWTS
jgi:hypothetical protein